MKEKSRVIHKDLSYEIMSAAMQVHNTLGCGFLEKMYENALVIELRKRGVKCERQKPLQVFYGKHIVGDYAADILVENKVILELKVTKEILDIHKAQVINYLKATGLKLGIILNFAQPRLRYQRLVL